MLVGDVVVAEQLPEPRLRHARAGATAGGSARRSPAGRRPLRARPRAPPAAAARTRWSRPLPRGGKPRRCRRPPDSAVAEIGAARSSVSRVRLVATLFVLALALVAAAPRSAQSEGSLRDRIGSSKSRERSLASAAARLGELERKASREVAILEGRLSAVQSDLTAAETHLAVTEEREREARRRVTRLRDRLAEVRTKLSGLLRERYMGERPDFVTVVLHADGFPQLLETLSFVKRVERADSRVLDVVRDARGEAGPRAGQAHRAGRAPAARGDGRARAARHARGHRRRPARAARHAHAGARRARRRAVAHAGGTQGRREDAEPPARRARPRRRRPAGRAARGRSRGRSCSASRAGATRRRTAPARRATTRSSTRPGRASAARRRTPTRAPRPSRTGSRRACGRGRGTAQLGMRGPRLTQPARSGRWNWSTPPRSRISGSWTRTATRACSRSRSRGSATSCGPRSTTSRSAGRPRGSSACATIPARPSPMDRYDDDWTRLAWVQAIGTMTVDRPPRRRSWQR